MTTIMLATALPWLRTSRASPGGMKQLSSLCNTVAAPLPRVTVLALEHDVDLSQRARIHVGATAGKYVAQSRPGEISAARTEPLQTQGGDAVMKGCLVGLRIAEAGDVHDQPPLPVSMR